jgi:hypothetical protein
MACYELGCVYLIKFYNTYRNLNKALIWLKKAISLGNYDAINKLEKTKKLLEKQLDY